MEFTHRDSVGVPDLFAAAVELRASYVVLSDYDFSPECILDPAVAAAEHACRDLGTFLAVVVARRRGKALACPYRRVLVGAGSAPAGGFAALVGAHLAWRSGASLKVSTVERRRDSVQRRLFERLSGSSSSFDPSTFRSGSGNSAFEQARRYMDSAGITTQFEFGTGDPTDVIVRAARYGEHDVLVTGLLDAPLTAIAPARATRGLLRLSPVDQMLVLDRVTLRLGTGTAAAELAATASLLQDMDLR